MKVEPVANLILVTVQDWLNDWLAILYAVCKLLLRFGRALIGRLRK
jgi:hypothetical protein